MKLLSRHPPENYLRDRKTYYHCELCSKRVSTYDKPPEEKICSGCLFSIIYNERKMILGES